MLVLQATNAGVKRPGYKTDFNMAAIQIKGTTRNLYSATFHCQNVETAHFVFFSILWGINPFKILSISSADTISVKRCFPSTEEGSFSFWHLLWWFKVILVPFSLSESVQSPIPSLNYSGTFLLKSTPASKEAEIKSSLSLSSIKPLA